MTNYTDDADTVDIDDIENFGEYTMVVESGGEQYSEEIIVYEVFEDVPIDGVYRCQVELRDVEGRFHMHPHPEFEDGVDFGSRRAEDEMRDWGQKARFVALVEGWE